MPGLDAAPLGHDNDTDTKPRNKPHDSNLEDFRSDDLVHIQSGSLNIPACVLKCTAKTVTVRVARSGDVRKFRWSNTHLAFASKGATLARGYSDNTGAWNN